MSELKYFKKARSEQGASKRYRDLAKEFHPDKATSDAEREEFNRIMQEINAEHQEVLVLIRHGFFAKKTSDDSEQRPKISVKNGVFDGLNKVAAAFQFTDAQKQQLVDRGREALNFAFDAFVENNFGRKIS